MPSKKLKDMDHERLNQLLIDTHPILRTPLFRVAQEQGKSRTHKATADAYELLLVYGEFSQVNDALLALDKIKSAIDNLLVGFPHA